MARRARGGGVAEVAAAAAGEAVLAGYRGKGLAGRLGFGRRPAVLVVDFVVGFTDARCPLSSPLEREIGATARLLESARRREVPVLFTTVSYAEGCRDGGLLVVKMPSMRWMVEGSEWVEIDPRLARRPEEPIVRKQYASAFFGTSLASTLTALGVDTVVVAGCTTSGCVRATVVDAIQHGFRPVVPRECVGDRAQAPHEANLLDIDGKYGDVVDLATVLKAIARTGGARE